MMSDYKIGFFRKIARGKLQGAEIKALIRDARALGTILFELHGGVKGLWVAVSPNGTYLDLR
jgi:hypothetical protein